MLTDAITYELSRLAYLAGIGMVLALVLIGVLAFIVGVRIMLEADPEYIGYVPYPRGVDKDDEL